MNWKLAIASFIIGYIFNFIKTKFLKSEEQKLLEQNIIFMTGFQQGVNSAKTNNEIVNISRKVMEHANNGDKMQ